MENLKDATRSVWGANPAGSTHALDEQPGSPEFFDRAYRKRREEEMPWLNDVIPFEETKGRQVLELGCGAGFDAFTFCESGAIYHGIDLTPENIDRTRAHLSHCGYDAEVMIGDAESISSPDETFEIVFSNGVLHHTPNIDAAFHEAFRVLRPGGEFWVIIYHRHSVFYWVTLWLCSYLFAGRWRKQTFRERVSEIEYTTSDEKPLVNVYSRREVLNMLRKTGFASVSLCVRKLNREDLPSGFLLTKLWTLIPARLLDSLGTHFGWYIIAKARRPTA